MDTNSLLYRMTKALILEDDAAIADLLTENEKSKELDPAFVDAVINETYASATYIAVVLIVKETIGSGGSYDDVIGARPTHIKIRK